MSESIVRKVQPFTIGTRLSVPSVPKEFPQSYLPSEALDNCVLQHNLNSLYLSRSQVCAHGSRLVLPIADQAASMKLNPEHAATEDHLNQNIASHSAVSRSIKKITISGSKKQSNTKMVLGSVTRSPPVNSNNNNNITNSSSPEQQQPRIVGVSCENNPKSHFKVLLSKESNEEPQLLQGEALTKLNGERSTEISAPEMQKKELQRRGSHQHDEALAAAKAHSESFTQQNSLFNKEALQAEAWIKGKLQDLKDGCNVQYCPLQDWEEAAQMLQRDLKDFENTLIQLNQLGEQLICKLNPTSDLVKKQLSQLREQWQNLRQMAANQTRALGAARSLKEFNKKVDKLEAWIKQKKEEEQSLVSVLGENVDKMQLTRRILDLKQDEQLHRNLHEEINNLALKLEKIGKAEGKNITMRKKHINKLWLKVQSYLKTYHENLQVALEISSFYQQADNTLDAMNNMRRTHATEELENFGDREIRDIASQIMMLDVSVSQLPKLPPTLAASVTRKQAEVKDFWALLQKDLRSGRTTHSLASSTFTREDADLLTPVHEVQCIMGSETHGIMGKEVKEEQNRLKGCRSITDYNSSGPTQRSQQEDHQSVNRSSSPEGDDSLGVNEPISTHGLKGEREPRAEPRLPVSHQGHPQLHLQLQKFTLSADKTLSWLKDNVSMATQVCLMASSEGPEAARRCQQSLEQEILKNRARIEVVKREGHGLVRAQHPGSSKIEEFLSQLEVLWEELRRRHQRNAVFLQASEKLGFRVVKVLQALGSLEAWLESVELSMKASALAGDSETMSRAEKESCLLEKEVAARSLELSALRAQVDRLHGHSHPHTQGLAARMEELERKYHCVLKALTQQSSQLQDTRMLAEFLEHLELEDSQKLTAEHYHLDKPLHSDISLVPTSLGLQRSDVRDPLIETMGDPVEELREAVEMLNNTVRERGRSQGHDHAIHELLSKHASLAVRVEECLCSSKELSLDILEKETDMAVQCEPEHSGFEPLQDRLGHLEIDYEIIREEVKKMEKEALHLKELCLEKAHVFEVKIQSALQAWSELGKSVMENRSRLQEFVELQGFFRSYLALISWTEDTRSCIFSNTALHVRREGQRPLAAELDVQIEQKFKEFDALATTAKTLLDSEHHLTQMVKERMEELRSMLGWISVHWRAQKQQRLHKQNREEPSHDNIYSEATMWNSFKQSLVPELEDLQESHIIKTSEGTTKTSESNEEIENKQPEDGYEIMNRIGPNGDSPKAHITVVKESSSSPVGGAVNLILSFGNTGESQVQLLDLPVVTDETLKETSEPVHRPSLPQSSPCKKLWRRCQGILENTFGSLKRKRKIYRQSADEVSAYLHVKDCSLAVAPVYESITLPRQKSRSATSDSPTLCPSSSSCSSQSFSVSEPQTTNVSFHPSRGSNGSSIFCSLKRMGKKRKRKRDERRHTIQRIMGVDEQASALHQYDSETVAYYTQTWPLKEGQRKKSLEKNSHVADAVAYMKNPLLKDIDSECSGENSITPYAVSSGPNTSPSEGPGRNQCRVLSLGSVLSFDLPKDVTLIPGIQDIITIAPPESKKASETDADPLSQRNTVLSSFRQTQVMSTITGSSTELQRSDAAAKDLLDEKSLQPSLEDPRVPYDDKARINESTEERDKNSTDLKLSINEINKPSKLRIYTNELHSCTSVTHKHECVSVHTLIRDLNGHQYHKCTSSQCEHVNSPQLKSNKASHVRVNLKSTMSVSVRQDSVDSGISTSSSFKLCTETPCPDQPLPKAVVGKLISLEVGGIEPTKTRENSAASSSPSSDSVDLNKEPLHVDHQQFEEEEEELEDIWNHTTTYRQSICSDIMYQPNQEPKEVVSSSSSATNPAVHYRNLVTASAPNLLIAEFKLPPHVQNSLGYDQWQSSKDHLPPLTIGERRSWAAFPNREPVSKTAVTVNEMASDLVKLPEVGDNPRYIYQYREEDEGEQEEVDELTSCSQNQPMNRLSVHMGLNEACPESLEDPVKPQEEQLTTGGRCFVLSGKPELQSMEGVLERKHKLQLGGKKAASRGWNSYHAVLYRQTLCFFQDRKDTLRSSACGLPLNLIGAECSPAPDYTKKPNCFRLRLRDGSEYLFNTNSCFMMKKWIMKIQASTGQSEFVSSPTNDPPLSLRPDQASGQRLSHHKATHTFPRLKQESSDQTKEIVILPKDQSHMFQSLRNDEKSKVSLLDPGCCDDDECSLTQTVSHRLAAETKSPSSSDSPASSSQDWHSSKHRSHSFTSATYQRINPVLPSHGAEGAEKGSNYCVTLVVGGSSTENASVSRSLEPAVLPLPSWQPDMYKDSALKSYSSLPRPRNKSVFKKFFGRKES